MRKNDKFNAPKHIFGNVQASDDNVTIFELFLSPMNKLTVLKTVRLKFNGAELSSCKLKKK